LIAQIVELAKIIVSRTSEANQQALLSNLAVNLETIQAYRPALLATLTEVSLEHAQRLAIIDEVGAGWVLYEQRQGQWVALTTQAGSVQRGQGIINNDTALFVYFLGIGFGEEVVAWHKQTAEHPPHDRIPHFIPAIYVIEPVSVYWLLFLLTGDRRSLLSDKRVFLFVGHAAFDHFIEAGSTESINYPSPSARLLYSFAVDRDQLGSRLDDALKGILQKQNTQAHQAFNEMNTYYDVHFGCRLADKIAQKRYDQIKVLGITTRYSTFVQYSTRDLLAGFSALGCQVEMLLEPTPHYMRTNNYNLIAFYQALPDVVICVDGLRSSIEPSFVPYITWIQDDLPRLVSPTEQALSPYDFVSVFAHGWQSLYQQRPYYANHPIGVLPLGFHEGSYFPADDVVKDIDVLYVSHLIDPELTLEPYRRGNMPQKHTSDEKKWLAANPNTAEYNHAMQVIVTALDCLSMDELLPLFDDQAHRQAWLQDLGIGEMSDSLFVLLSELDGKRGRIGNDILSQLKCRPMQALANAGVSIAVYGKHWAAFPELAPFAHGAADNGEALNLLHNRSKICINNSALVSFHMRALEIMASGAFMLSRRIPLDHDLMPITELFTEGNEVALFDETNLVEQVTYYLAHDEVRNSMAQAALHNLRQHHTYRQRAEQLLTEIEARFTYLCASSKEGMA
jgi:hypothetical protein